MTISLLTQARENRLDALANLKAKRASTENAGNILRLDFSASRRSPKAVFLSRRTMQESEKLAA
ncbi:MAG: hypothetical protein AAF408_13090 [Pseudomonadota bacterium]